MRDLDLETYDRLVGLVHEAGLDPAGWQAALDAVDAHVDGAYLALHAHDLRASDTLGIVSTRYGADAIARYETYYGSVNPFPAAAMGVPAMKALAFDRFVSRAELLRSEFYADFLRPNEDVGAGGGVVIHRGRDRMVLMSGQVRFRDEDAVQPRLLAVLDRLAPHMRRAFDAQRRLGGARLGGDGVLRAAGAAVLLDARARIVEATPAAEALMAEGDRIERGRGGRLRPASRRAATWLARTLRRFAAGEAGSGPDVCALGGGGRGVAVLEPVPIPADGAARMARAALAAPPVGLLVLRPGPTDPARARRALRRLWGVGEAEAAVALALAAGAAPAEIAAAKGVALRTVRAQIRALLRATGCDRPAELTALVRDVAG